MALATVFLAGSLSMAAQKPAIPAATVEYKGTVGQQHVTFSLEVRGETLDGGHYAYDGQKSEIHFTEARIFGTTAVLTDEDGNTLHLHFRTANGAGAPDWSAAAALEGTLDRGELDLPVSLQRQPMGAAAKR